MSSLVIVQVLSTPASIVPVQSPEKLALYPLGPVSVTLKVSPASRVVVVPGVSAPGKLVPPLSLREIVKSLDSAVPPSSLTTVLMTVNVPVCSVLVKVQVIVSADSSVIAVGSEIVFPRSLMQLTVVTQSAPASSSVTE